VVAYGLAELADEDGMGRPLSSGSIKELTFGTFKDANGETMGEIPGGVIRT
jgi:hypothetical protein